MTAVPVGLLALAAGVLGLVIGSFLNVVVHRLPAGVSLVTPPSACPSCHRRVAVRDNIPVVSWLLLRGRCRHCGEGISPRYPLVELLTGLLYAGAAVRFGWSLELAVAAILTASGVALVAIDLEHRRLPFAITRTAALGCVAVLAVDIVLAGPQPALRGLALAAIWLAVYGGVWLLTAGRGMGLGDVALAPVLGLALGWLGWGPGLVGLLAGFLVGALVGVLLMLTGRAGRRSRVPHGPFMLAGAAVALFAGQQLWQGYLHVVGLA